MAGRHVKYYALFLFGLIAYLVSLFLSSDFFYRFLPYGAVTDTASFFLQKAPFLVFLILAALILRKPPLVAWGTRVAAVCFLFAVAAEGFVTLYHHIAGGNSDTMDRYFDLYIAAGNINTIAGVAYAAGLLLFCAAFVKSVYKPLRVCAIIAALGRTAAMVLVMADSLLFDLSYRFSQTGGSYYTLTQTFSSLADLSLVAIFVGLLLWFYHERSGGADEFFL